MVVRCFIASPRFSCLEINHQPVMYQCITFKSTFKSLIKVSKNSTSIYYKLGWQMGQWCLTYALITTYPCNKSTWHIPQLLRLDLQISHVSGDLHYRLFFKRWRKVGVGFGLKWKTQHQHTKKNKLIQARWVVKYLVYRHAWRILVSWLS